MKTFLIQLVSGVAVGVAFIRTGTIDSEGWRLLATFGSYLLLQLLFINRYPRNAALSEAMKGVCRKKFGSRVDVDVTIK